MTTHYNHLSKRAACGRASARTTTDKSKVTLHLMPTDPPIPPTRLNTLSELYQAAQAKKAVTVGMIHRKPTPAAWVLSYQGSLIHQLLETGIYLYTKPNP